MPRATRRWLLALALVTGASLMFQVALTRLLATLLAYHFGFLAVSVSLVGIGTGGLLVYLWPDRFLQRPNEALARWCCVNAAGLLLCPMVIVRLNLDHPYQAGKSPGIAFFFGLAGVCLSAMVPSLASGVVVAVAIRNAGDAIGKVYATDLVGAGAGALLAVPMLNLVDPPQLMALLGALSLGAAALFVGSVVPRGARSRIAGALALVLIVSVIGTDVAQPDQDFFKGNETKIVSSEWNALARVVGYSSESSVARAGQVVYDRAWAPIVEAEFDDLPSSAELGLMPQGIGFSFAKGGHALVIGGGGGRDIVNALSEGVERIDVIELNEGIRDVVDGELGDISGRPYSMPGVETKIGEGRATLARSKRIYDQIHIGFTDTLSPESAQGFALTENNLYTKEAFEDYFDHLNSNGILSVSRLTQLVGREAIRATVLTLASLEARGFENPENNVVVLRALDFLGGDFATTLARTRAWTATELDDLRARAAERGVAVVMAPGGPYIDDWERLNAAGDWQTFCHDYALDICPPSDDRPFFFNMRRRSSLFSTNYRVSTNDPVDTLIVTALILLVLSLIGFGVPVLLRRRDAQRLTFGNFTYFSALGFGFITLEIVLIQRFVLFLGFPTYALSVVLAGLLTATGIGSWIAGRGSFVTTHLRAVLAAAVGVMLLAAFALPTLLRGGIDWPMPVRVLATLLVLLPIGVLLGTAMPTGLSVLERVRPASIPYVWAVNGLTSVLGSVVSIVIALYLGFRITTLVAAACYLVALAAAPSTRDAIAARDAGEAGDPDASNASDAVLVTDAIA